MRPTVRGSEIFVKAMHFHFIIKITDIGPEAFPTRNNYDNLVCLSYRTEVDEELS
jgi:hypothetical protein